MKRAITVKEVALYGSEVGDRSTPRCVADLGERATANQKWYAVNTQPNAEARARLNLERQGFVCFFPQYRSSYRLRGRHVARLKALFANYLFLRMDVSRTPWRSIDNTYGVRSIVKQGDRPVSLPSGCVEALIARCGDDGLYSFAAQLSVGIRVEFHNGPFAGFIGELEALDSRGRIRVLLELMGRTSTIQSTVADVVPAGATPGKTTKQDLKATRLDRASAVSGLRPA